MRSDDPTSVRPRRTTDPASRDSLLRVWNPRTSPVLRRKLRSLDRAPHPSPVVFCSWISQPCAPSSSDEARCHVSAITTPLPTRTSPSAWRWRKSAVDWCSTTCRSHLGPEGRSKVSGDIPALVTGTLTGLIATTAFLLALFVGFSVLLNFPKLRKSGGGTLTVRSLDER